MKIKSSAQLMRRICLCAPSVKWKRESLSLISLSSAGTAAKRSPWFSLAARASYINPPVRGMTGLVTRLLNTPHSRVMHSLFASLTRKLAHIGGERARAEISMHTRRSLREINGAFYFAWREQSVTGAEREKRASDDEPMRKSLK